MLSLRFLSTLCFLVLWGRIEGSTFECIYLEDIDYGKTCLLSNLTDQYGATKEVMFHVPTDYNGVQTGKSDYKLIHIAFNSSLNQVPVEIFKEFKNVEGVKIYQANLTKLDGNSFKFATKLKTLQVRENEIKRVHVDDVKYLENLETLDLENNPISYIDPKIFDHLKKLKLVDLRRTKCVNLKFQLLSEGDILNMKEKLRNCFNMSDIFAPTLKENFDVREIVKTEKPDEKTVQEKFDARSNLLGAVKPSADTPTEVNPKVLEYLEKIKEMNGRIQKCLNVTRDLIIAGDFLKLNETLKNCFNMSDIFPATSTPLKVLFDARDVSEDSKPILSPKSLLGAAKLDKSTTIPPKVLDYLEKIKEASERMNSCLNETFKLIDAGDFTSLNESFKNCFNMSDIFPPKEKPLKTLFDAREITDSEAILSPKMLLEVLEYLEKIKEGKERIQKCLNVTRDLIIAGDFLKLNETLKNCFNMSDIFPAIPKPLKALFDARDVSGDSKTVMSPKSLLGAAKLDTPTAIPPKVLDYLEKVKQARERMMNCLNETFKLIDAGDFTSLNESFKNCFNMSDIFPPKEPLETSFDALFTFPTFTESQPISSTFDVREKTSGNPPKQQFVGGFSLLAVPPPKSVEKIPLKSTFDARQTLSATSQAEPKTLTQTFGQPLTAVMPPSKKPFRPTTTEQPIYVKYEQKDVFDFIIQNYINNLKFATNLVVGAQSEFFWVLLIVCMVFLAVEVYLVCMKQQGSRLYVQLPSRDDY